ncbi:MAG: cation-translocating P-type ATPase [Negativicutes bacterium]|nr:cation-translocating P-type ATPase [Negativicutes bacterium]
MEKWYARRAEEALEFWRTDEEDGLSTGEVRDRLARFGYNEMAEKTKVSWWRRFLAQFQDFMVLVLLAATLISGLLGEYTDAVTILAIVLINAGLGFVQEHRAEQSMDALKRLSAPTARVVRNGTIQHIPARDLVPGDILLLEPGDIIAADARLAAASNLEAEEAALTGESLPVRKLADRVYPEDVTLGDRKNMVYAGTMITRGRGKGIVCATAMNTEVGRIAGMIQAVEEDETPLQRRLDHLGKWLVWGCLLVCLLVVVTGVAKGQPLFLMCMTGISLAVAAIPEGLPAIVTVALALGVQRMIRKNAIVRKLPAVETLGCTTVICSDKTGTLTQNAMTVRKIFTGSNHVYEISGVGYEIKGEFLLNKQEFDVKKDKCLQQCLFIGALCNNSVLKQNNVGITGIWRRLSGSGWSVEGDPTEGALVVAGAKAGVWRSNIEKSQVRVGEIPFEAERRRMSVAYRQGDGAVVLYSKGAPDTVLELCRYYFDGERERPLTPEIMARIVAANEALTSEALRVLAVAYRRLAAAEAANVDEAAERELVFAGLAGMIDPPREEARSAIAVCRQAGIKTVMITGDHRNTAVAIAQELRLYKEGTSLAVTGRELDSVSDRELAAMVNNVAVYARVSPAHKLRIVRALKQNGHIVAMTGDGVNDAPAIKEADIGIAMGLTGTDVSREAAAMTLVDDNFATIVAAVEEGRGIYDNIRKFIRYLLSCNIGEVLTMFVAGLAGFPMPLLPVQILWVNLVTDGLPAMALGVDPKEPDIMNRPPRNPAESVFSRGLSRKIITRGLQIGLSTVGVFMLVYLFEHDLALARTMAFSTLVFCQLFHVYDCRSEVLTIFELGLTGNKYLLLATCCSTLMQLAVIYVPFLRDIFATVPLDTAHWLVIFTVAGWTFLLGALKHLLWRRRLPVRSLLSRG